MKHHYCLVPLVTSFLNPPNNYRNNDAILALTRHAFDQRIHVYPMVKSKKIYKNQPSGFMNLKYLLIVLVLTLSSETHAQRTMWLLPDFATVQYSGSIGYFSAGMGYDVLKSKARFSAHYGIVPDFQGASLNVVSLKLFFKPTALTIWNRVRMNPVDIGLMGSYHFGGKLQEELPDGVYPKGYYWWRPALRAHLGMESSVTYEFPKGHSLKSITGYIDFNTNEFYFLNFIQHMNTLRLWDVVKIGTGARLYF